MNSSLPVSATVTDIKPLTADTTLFTIRPCLDHPVASAFLPGQFLQFSLPGVGEFPVSYCGFPATDGTIELCIRHIGHVTMPLRSTVIGAAVGVRGPFGTGFPLPEYDGQDLLLIAGGLGIAPIRSLLLALLKQREKHGRLIVLYGSREPATQLFLAELLQSQKLNLIELHLAVDKAGNGSNLLSECRISLLPALLDQIIIDPTRVCAAICGPPVVYQALVTGLQSLGVRDDRIYLSLERRMKCGVGRCGHCAVAGRLCCLDGPVFSYAEISEMKETLQ